MECVGSRLGYEVVTEPALLPYCADMFSVSSWNSWTVSSIGVVDGSAAEAFVGGTVDQEAVEVFAQAVYYRVLRRFQSTPRTFTAPGDIWIKS